MVHEKTNGKIHLPQTNFDNCWRKFIEILCQLDFLESMTRYCLLQTYLFLHWASIRHRDIDIENNPSRWMLNWKSLLFCPSLFIVFHGARIYIVECRRNSNDKNRTDSWCCWLCFKFLPVSVGVQRVLCSLCYVCISVHFVCYSSR